MATKRTQTKSDPNSARNPRSTNAPDSDQLKDTAVDSLELNPDDDDITVLNNASEQSAPDAEPLDELLLNSDDQITTPLPDDDEIIMAAFKDDDEDDEDDEDDDIEDDELAAHADDDDFDHNISIATLDKSSTGVSSRRMTLDPDDDDEDVDDVEDMIEPISEVLEPIYEDEDDEPTLDDSDTKDGGEPPLSDEGVIPEDFGDETEEDIQNAANILSSSGLLGLGVKGGKRADIASVKEFVMGTKASTVDLEQEFDDEGMPLDLDDEEDEEVDDDDVGEKGITDEYPDEDEESEFALTSQSSFGRVWELNEDTYVTITEPGQSYVYELDEEDEEDQEMASMRRGKQGGWSGGLASYPADSLPKGSKEWIARRAYELMTKATPKEMFRWTRWHDNPPESITELYPEDLPPPTPLGKTTLKFSSPTTETATIGKDTSGTVGALEDQKAEDSEVRQNALERSIRFPCTYKFKVEGAGDDFPSCLRETVESAIERKLPEMELEVEPAGRYERVVIPVKVESAQEVTLVYDALRNDPSVKFSFG